MARARATATAGTAGVDWPADRRPRLRLATHARLADRGFAVRYLGGFHALHLHDYAGRMRLGDRELALQPGDVTLTPADAPSWYDLPEPGHHLVVHFYAPPPDEEDDDAGRSIALPMHVSLGRRHALAHHQLAEIAHLHGRSHGSSSAQDAAAQLMLGLLHWLAAEGRAARRESDGTGADAAVRWAAELIEQRLHAPVSVPRLAQEVGLSQNYLARCFRARFGVTIPRYTLMRRVQVARDLLARTGLPIGRIAARVGMHDPQHFNKQFRAVTGVSPSAYRKGAGG